MKVMSPAFSKVDRVLGGLIMAGSLGVGLVVAAVNAGQFSLAVLAMAIPFATPGFAAGLGIYLSKKWGFWVAIALGLFWLLPIPLSFLFDDGKPLAAIANGLPAIVVLCLCEFRLRGRLGPPLS